MNSRTILAALFAILLNTVTTFASAETIQTTIVRVNESNASNLDHLIYLSYDGRVAYVKATDALTLETIRAAEQSGLALEIELDDASRILSFKKLSADHPLSIQSSDSKTTSPLYDDPAPFSATILPDYASANTIFRQMNPNARRRSQCYDRAHIWSYEAYQRSRLSSSKVFLFFTQRYIRTWGYKWWFHVSPFVHVREGNQITEYVTDRVFMQQPVHMKDWTDFFMYSKAWCPQVARYSDYSEHQWVQDCYLIKTSMYFWQPRDIERLEQGENPKYQFIPHEVNWAYQHAF